MRKYPKDIGEIENKAQGFPSRHKGHNKKKGYERDLR